MRGASNPIIGVTCRRMDYGLEPWMTQQQGAIQPMIDAVERAGGAPVLIPLIDNEGTLRSIYKTLDGVLLVGGGDVNPRLYDEAPVVPLQNPDDLLDRVELPLARWAAEEGKPLFGICRGHQIINVALGGSLYQDTAVATGTDIEHDESWLEHNYTKMVHEIMVEADSRLAKLLGSTQLAVNSLHHQSINRIAPTTRPVAWAPDGIIEAVEGTSGGFLLGVQSHPEHVAHQDARWQNVYNGFVAAADAYRQPHRHAIRRLKTA